MSYFGRKLTSLATHNSSFFFELQRFSVGLMVSECSKFGKSWDDF